jgi:hypothetical protein
VSSCHLILVICESPESDDSQSLGAGLVVTEAGTGGPVGTSNCATGPSTETAGTTQYCTGQTGAIFTISSRGRIIPVLRCSPVPHAKCDHISSGRRLRIEAMIQL